MARRITRRSFLGALGAVSAAAAGASSAFREAAWAGRVRSPFRVSIISDEISADFGRACEVASREFGMQWIELRTLWDKNLIHLDSKEVSEAQRIVRKYGLQVSDIASPLFKVDFKGAPRSRFSEQDDFHADFTFDQQDEVLERALELARIFQADRVRCFDFWRLDDPVPYRAAINQKLLEAAVKAGKRGMTLMLENDVGLNTATGAEAAQVMKAIKSPHLMLNWDPGNATASREKAYPDGYHLLPKERIGHCHCKDIVKKGGEFESAPMGDGIVDWRGQFAALKRDGYGFAVSLETEWTGGGTPEESSRQSWAGMKKLLQEAKAG